MPRSNFQQMACPIARSLAHIGEWWSILILRDAFHGLSRFDDFQQSLGIASNMLARRLKALVASGLMERRLYCAHPPRHEYVLTQRGRDFQPVLMSLNAWGNQHFAPEGPSVVIMDTLTGRRAQPVLIDAISGLAMHGPRFQAVAGPAATDAVRQRYSAADSAQDANP